MHEGWPSEAHFPREDEWLALPPPEITPDFVARTLRGRAEERVLDEPDPRFSALLQHYRPPAPAGGSIEAILHRWRHERTPSWRRLLARYSAPAPAPEFTERVLAALRARPAPRRARGMALAAAAALVVAALWAVWPASRGREAMPTAVLPASAFAADRWAPAFSARVAPSRGPAMEDPTLALLALTRAEGRR